MIVDKQLLNDVNIFIVITIILFIVSFYLFLKLIILTTIRDELIKENNLIKQQLQKEKEERDLKLLIEKIEERKRKYFRKYEI